MVNIVIETIKKYISAEDVLFVFPSQTAAGMWARKTCTSGIIRSAASGRFLAWDKFKEQAAEKKTGEPVSDVIRKIFAEILIKKNAEAAKNHAENDESGLPDFPLKSIIPAEYAGEGRIFSAFIAGLLPSLASWEKLMYKHFPDARSSFNDPEDRDLSLIKNEYSQFLDRFGYYEPSWEEIKIDGREKKYVIFFPELIEDFAEYENLLKPPGFIKISGASVHINSGILQLYPSVRTEIRSMVLEMQKLHEEEEIPYEEMAVSVPGLENMEAGLQKEFYLHHIPVTRRAGKPLGRTGTGKLFSLINECTASLFSFNSLKALVLNDNVPWKDPQKNRDLVRFGMEYNCVCSYFQNGKPQDIWEEAFGELHTAEAAVLRNYYGDLKDQIRAFTGSKNFADIRKNYFIFKKTFLDMEKISEENDAVISRCIVELSSLEELEKKFNDPETIPARPFDFFVSHLNEKEYLGAGRIHGVNIFRWRVASAAPFRCHYVLNASQGAAAVLYSPMKFLRQDKRKTLGLEETDATGAFFSLCHTGDDVNFTAHTEISCSSQTYSGWSVPHSFFAGGRIIEGPPCPPDYYEDERSFWKETENNGNIGRIYPLQKLSFNNWLEPLKGDRKDFSFFASPVPADSHVHKMISERLPCQDGILAVTATLDLNEFYKCPLLWLYRRIFAINEFSLEAALLDDTALGILYHRIMESLFMKIKNLSGTFDSINMEKYKKWAEEITKDEIKKEHAFKGPLAVPLVSPQAEGMSKKIGALLELEKKYFDNYSVGELELPVSYQTGDLVIRGIIDRVSVSPDGIPVIIDYKTGEAPEQIDIGELEDRPLAEFQTPIYIKLLEEKINENITQKKIRTEGACFYSINKKKIKVVVGERTRAGSKTLDREEYETILEAADKQIHEFSEKVKGLDMKPGEIRLSDCLKCRYKTICRSAYFLNSV